MTNSQPHLKKPTTRQLNYLKDLAIKTGGSFAWPRTFGQASAEITRLRNCGPTSAVERRREMKQLREDFAMKPNDSAAVSPEEIGGYGASCRWLHQAPT